MKFKILLIGYCLLPATLPAQPATTAPEPTVETRVVEVVRNFEGEITDTDRRTLPLQTTDSIGAFSSSFTYNIEPAALPVFSVTKEIPPAAITEKKIPPADGAGYARLGAGLPLAPLADLYLHKAADRWLLNLYFNHRSYWASAPLTIDPPANNALPERIAGNNMQHDAGLSASMHTSKIVLHFNADYKHRYLLFHGHDTAFLRHLADNNPDYLDAIRRNDDGLRKALGQTYHILTAEAGIASNSAPDRFSYATDVQFGYTGGAMAAVSEYTGHIRGRLSQPFTTVHSADVAFKAIAYNKGNATHWSDGLFTVTPAYVYQQNDTKLSVGLNLEGIYTSHNEKLSLDLHPNISYTRRFADYLTLHASVEGETSCNTYRQLALENPYIVPDLSVYNTHKPWEFTLGAGGRIFNVAGYHLFAAYGFFKQMYFYVNSRDSLPATGNGNGLPAYDGLRHNFDVRYGQTNRLTLGADIDYSADDFEALLEGRYYAYSFVQNTATDNAWHKPSWELRGKLRYRYERYTFEAGWYARGTAPVALSAPVDKSAPGNTVPTVVATLPAYTDLSLQIEYRLNKWLTAFVYGQNLLNRHYGNYYLYYAPGINGGVGMTAVF
ncbi:MAG: hypothetical protein LBS12_00220 [Prevotellaceae bacterium]|jgi:hypothetical protein|nr:hypothetical protein [Prevotellaceae bacterium]